MKTLPTSYAAALAQPQKWPRLWCRFYMVESVAAYQFHADFSAGPVTSAPQTYYDLLSFPTGNTQTVQIEQGQSTIGTFKITALDKDGLMSKYMGNPGAGLTSAVASADTTVSASIAGGLNNAYPPFGTIRVDSEYISYTTVTGSQFSGLTRGACSANRAAHAAPTSVQNAEQIRPNQAVQFFVGDDSVAWAQYASLVTMQVVERSQTQFGVYDIVCQDLQRWLKRYAFLDAAPDTSSATNTLTRQGNPLTLLLQAWTTTSGGGNSSYDLGDGRGVGIPQNWVAITSVEALRDSQFPNDVYTFRFNAPVDVKQWGEDLLKTLNCYPFVTQSGQLSVKRIAASGTAVGSLSMATIIGIPKWTAGDNLIANQLLFMYDYGLSSPGVYGTREMFSSDESVRKYGRKPAFQIEAQGVWTAQSGAAIALNRATRFFERYGDPPPSLQLEAHYSQLVYDIGDVVTVTHSYVPNPKTGQTGLNGAVFEITDLRPVLNPAEGTPRVQFTLLHTGAADMPATPTKQSSKGGGGTGGPAPATPTGLTVTGCSFVAADGTLIGFAVASWTANTEADLSSYLGRGRRQVGNDPYYTFSVPKGLTSLRIDGLATGVGFEGQIAAVDYDQNMSPWSSVATFTVPGSSITAPATVGGLAAVGKTSLIHVTWTANSEKNLLGYRGQRSSTGSFQGEEATIWAGLVTQYDDTTLDFGLNQTFYYRGRAEATDGGVGPYGTIVSATRDTTAPGMPTSFQITTSYAVQTDGALTGTVVASWAAPTDLDLGGYVGRVRDLNAEAGGNAALFQAAYSRRLTVTDNPAISMGDIDFTLAGWFFANSPGNTQGLLAKWDNAPGQEYLIQTGGGLFQFYISNNGTAATPVTANSFGPIPAATWCYVVAWHDSAANLLNIRVNASAINTVAYTLGGRDGTATLVVGAGAGGTSALEGRINAVGIWKRVLTAAEQTSLYNSGKGLLYTDLSTAVKSSLVAWWNLDETSGQRTDNHGSSHLTDVNSVSFTKGVVGIGSGGWIYLNAPRDAQMYRATGVPPGVPYAAQISAVDIWGNQSSYTSVVSFICPGSGGTLAAPTGLTATPGFRSVVLKMTPSTDTRVIGYEGWRATNSAMAANSLSAVVGLITTYVDADLDPALTYYYKTRAIARDGLQSAFSSLVFATPNTVQSGSVADRAILTSNVNTQAITSTRRQAVNFQQSAPFALNSGEAANIVFTHNLGYIPLITPISNDQLVPSHNPIFLASLTNSTFTVGFKALSIVSPTTYTITAYHW